MGRQGSKQVSHIGGAIICGMTTADDCSFLSLIFSRSPTLPCNAAGTEAIQADQARNV